MALQVLAAQNRNAGRLAHELELLESNGVPWAMPKQWSVMGDKRRKGGHMQTTALICGPVRKYRPAVASRRHHTHCTTERGGAQGCCGSCAKSPFVNVDPH
jgi:hypothetical protein